MMPKNRLDAFCKIHDCTRDEFFKLVKGVVRDVNKMTFEEIQKELGY